MYTLTEHDSPDLRNAQSRVDELIRRWVGN